MMTLKFPIIKTVFIFVFLNEFLIRLVPGNQSLKMVAILFLYISGVLLFYYALKNLDKLRSVHLYFKIILLLLFIWSFFTIFRSVNENSKDLITLFTHYRVGGWDWVTPLALFFGLTITNWIKLFPLLIKFLVWGIVFAIAHLILHVHLSAIPLLSVYPVLLLTYFYQKVNVKKLIILSAIIYVLFSFFVYSNRSSLIIFSLFLVFFFFEYLRSTHISKYKKLFLSIVLSVSMVLLLVNINDISNSILGNKEMSTDTRTFLFMEMFSDISEEERIIGRGALGKYYSPYFEMLQRLDVQGDATYRSTNEVGYLHMILKGGYIMLVLYLLILIPAAYLGIFRSKNIIARMSGYIIVFFLIMFILIYPPEYRIHFLILWMAVGTAISKSARKVKNSDLLVKRKGRLEFAKK